MQSDMEYKEVFNEKLRPFNCHIVTFRRLMKEFQPQSPIYASSFLCDEAEFSLHTNYRKVQSDWPLTCALHLSITIDILPSIDWFLPRPGPAKNKVEKSNQSLYFKLKRSGSKLFFPALAVEALFKSSRSCQKVHFNPNSRLKPKSQKLPPGTLQNEKRVPI